jgi:hypothetical protein
MTLHDNTSSNSYLDGHFPSDSSSNLPLYSTTLDLMLLQNELDSWKQSYSKASWEIDQLKNENSILQLDVSIWKARFFALRSGFIELDRKMKEIMTSFNGWKD